VSYTLLSESTPVARKAHRCIWCGERIAAGERYTHERSIYDGGFQNHRERRLACRRRPRVHAAQRATASSGRRL
jgi:hypothetical protein